MKSLFTLSCFSFVILLSVPQCSTTKKNAVYPTPGKGNASALLCWSEITKEERSRLNLPDTFTLSFSLWKLDTAALQKGLDEFSKKPGQNHLLSMPSPDKGLKTFQVMLQPDSVSGDENEVCYAGSNAENSKQKGRFCLANHEFYGVIEAGPDYIVTEALRGNTAGLYLCCYKKTSRNTNR